MRITVAYMPKFFGEDAKEYPWILMVSDIYSVYELTSLLIENKIDVFKTHQVSRYFGFKTQKEAIFYSLAVKEQP